MYNREIRLSGLNFLRLCNNKLIQPFHFNRFGNSVSSSEAIYRYCAFQLFLPFAKTLALGSTLKEITLKIGLRLEFFAQIPSYYLVVWN